jgi:hypothetical protein
MYIPEHYDRRNGTPLVDGSHRRANAASPRARHQSRAAQIGSENQVGVNRVPEKCSLSQPSIFRFKGFPATLVDPPEGGFFGQCAY